MGDTAELILKIIGLIVGLAGLVVVYAAPKIVDKNGLAEKKQIDPERIANLDEDGVKKFKRDMAILDVKIKGILIALPGFAIILILFRI